MKLPALALLWLVLPVATSSAESPYAGQESRPVKSLSPSDIEALENGDGMGLAKLAELNHYPGPKHVLELTQQLDLTPEQLAGTRAIFHEMRASARQIGKAVLEAEASLDRAFADNSIDHAGLRRHLNEIAELRASLLVCGGGENLCLKFEQSFHLSPPNPGL